MGTSTSKAATKATQATTTTARKYPTRSPPISARNKAPPPPPPANTTHPPPETAEAQDTTSSADPALLSRLQTLGPVQPNPTFSHSSTYTFTPQAPLRNPDNPRPHQAPSPQSSQSSHDPSLSSSFIPSASNPQQSIFPQERGREGGGRGRINPAVSLLTARYRLAAEAEAEFSNLGKRGSEGGRSFLDVGTIRKILELREKGVGEAEIERRFELRQGVVARLGREGVVGVAG